MTKTYKARPCVVCEKDNTRRGVTCSSACAAKKRAETAKSMPLTCALCAKEFFTKDGKGKYCSDSHYKPCEVCGAKFEIPKGKENRANPTCGPHCGAVYSHRNPESKETRKKNNLEKHGVEYTFQREDVKSKIAANPKHQATKYGSEGFKQIMLNKYGVENAFLLPNAVPGRISSINKVWKEKLEQETGLDWELEKLVQGIRTIDLYCETNGVKLAIEINPTATHNAYKHLIACNRRNCSEFPCAAHGKGRQYHRDRVKFLKEKDIALISIFDWTDEKKILEFIKAKLKLQNRKFFAKNIEVKLITQTEANKFLKEHHLLGGSKNQSYCLGLFSENELLQVQTYSKTKNEGEWEARRLATKNDVYVIGGVSKGTTKFVNDMKPKRIIAYSDLNLGFSSFDSDFNHFSGREEIAPSKCWSKGDKMILDKTAAFQSADRLLGIAKNSATSIYPEDWTNEEVFLAEGWLPVWDCGKIKETWENNS